MKVDIKITNECKTRTEVMLIHSNSYDGNAKYQLVSQEGDKAMTNKIYNVKLQ